MSDLTELAAVVARLAEGPGLLAKRNDLIRAALAAGTPYRELTDATGLGRQRLDKIRKQ